MTAKEMETFLALAAGIAALSVAVVVCVLRVFMSWRELKVYVAVYAVTLLCEMPVLLHLAYLAARVAA